MWLQTDGGGDVIVVLSRKHRIQFAALALAGGTAVGYFFLPIVGLGLVFSMFGLALRWRVLLLIALVLGVGFIRGLISPHDVPARGAENSNLVVVGLERTKDWMTRSISRSLPSPEGPLLGGLLLGSREELPFELRQDFRRTGTSHIVAVSGFNVTIVVTMIAALFRALPLPRVVRTIAVFLAITAFVVLTGASPSVIRAGIMGSLVVLSREVGRLSDGIHSLVLSASVMVFASPATITSIGFQLSVVATAGLMLFGETLEERLKFIPEWFGLRGSLASTLAAILATQPLISLYFSQLSLIAPVVNLLVLPLIPLAMACGFAVALVVGIVPVLSPFVSWVSWAPLKAIIEIVRIGASVPLASVKIPVLGSLFAACAFAAIAAFTALRQRKFHAHT